MLCNRPESHLPYPRALHLPHTLQFSQSGRDCKDDEDKGINNLQVKKRLNQDATIPKYIY